MTFLMSWFNARTIVGSVPPGANTPSVIGTSKSGTPISASVLTSRSSSIRSLPAMTSGRSCPLAKYGSPSDVARNIASSWPPSMSARMGAPPL